MQPPPQQNPFDDQNNETYERSTQGLQRPLQPQNNGMVATSGPLPLPHTAELETNPYHPGYRPPQSYTHGQERSVNNVTMHGAGGVAVQDSPSPVETRQPVQYRF